MNKKHIYTAPAVEVIRLSFKETCLTTLSNATPALSNSSTEEATDYNDGNVITW